MTSRSTSSWPPSTTWSPASIRVQADEVTYNLHIIIRFELEQALLADDLPIGDLARRLEPEVPRGIGDHARERRRGLPAGHPLERRARWATSRPTRWATSTRRSSSPRPAQIWPDWTSRSPGVISANCLAWLRDHVHRHGQRYRSVPLIERATGAKPDYRPLIGALKHKYGELYGH